MEARGRQIGGRELDQRVEQTLIDGLVCVGQVVGIDATRPPPLTGKPTYWVDRRGAAYVDRQRSARRGNLTILHRNLIQTWQQPRSVGPVLRWLLVQLDAINAAGIVTTRGPTAVPETPDERVSASEPVAAQSSLVNSGSSRSPTRSSGTNRCTTT